jgi:hypothetical protein
VDEATDDGDEEDIVAEDAPWWGLGPVAAAPWGWCIRPVVAIPWRLSSFPPLFRRALLLLLVLALLLAPPEPGGWIRGGFSRAGLVVPAMWLPLPRLAASSSSHVRVPEGGMVDGADADAEDGAAAP